MYAPEDKTSEIEKALTDKILTRLAVVFTDYKNAGFKHSAQVTKYIMAEIETVTGYKGSLEEVHPALNSENDIMQ